MPISSGFGNGVTSFATRDYQSFVPDTEYYPTRSALAHHTRKYPRRLNEYDSPYLPKSTSSLPSYVKTSQDNPVWSMHGVGRIELTDKRTSVRPGSIPVYTGPFSLEHYENQFPIDEYNWEYDWDEHMSMLDRNDSSVGNVIKPEENSQEIETSKCLRFFKDFWPLLLFVAWTLLLVIGLGGMIMFN